MTPKEYVALLERLGHTPFSAGQSGLLGIRKRQSIRYSQDDSTISPTVAILLRLLVDLADRQKRVGRDVVCPLCSGHGRVPRG